MLTEAKGVSLDKIREALSNLREKIRWDKPQLADEHVAKRIKLDHLPKDATLTDYEKTVQQIINDPTSEVFVHQFGSKSSLLVTGMFKGRRWMVMTDFKGVMRTAFPPETYWWTSNAPGMSRVGLLKDILP